MSATLTRTRTGDATPDSSPDAALARQAGGAISAFLNGEPQMTLTLAQTDGSQLQTVVPTAALRILARALGEMGEGRPVTLMPDEAELTTHQAARLLGVSRPYLIKKMEAGEIPFRRVGTHRRIRHADLLAYEERDREERHRGLDELVRLSEEMGLYDDDYAAVRK